LPYLDLLEIIRLIYNANHVKFQERGDSYEDKRAGDKRPGRTNSLLKNSTNSDYTDKRLDFTD